MSYKIPYVADLKQNFQDKLLTSFIEDVIYHIDYSYVNGGMNWEIYEEFLDNNKYKVFINEMVKKNYTVVLHRKQRQETETKLNKGSEDYDLTKCGYLEVRWDSKIIVQNLKIFSPSINKRIDRSIDNDTNAKYIAI